MHNILVAIDSFESATITSPLIEKTIELAKAFSSKVRILHVAPKLREAPFNIDKKVLRNEVAHELHDCLLYTSDAADDLYTVLISVVGGS